MSISEYFSFIFSSLSGSSSTALVLVQVVLLLYVFGMILVPVLYLVTSLVCRSYLAGFTKNKPGQAFIPCVGIGRTGAAAGFRIFSWITAVVITVTEGLWFLFSLVMALFTMGVLGEAMDSFFLHSMAPIIVILLVLLPVSLVLRIVYGVRLALAAGKQKKAAATTAVAETEGTKS